MYVSVGAGISSLLYFPHSVVQVYPAYCTFHTLFFQIKLIDTLWKLWTQVPMFGQRSSQFVDILGYVTISSRDLFTHQPDMKQRVAKEAIAQLRRQNQLLTRHPNAHIYSQLASLVNFDGYYLESEPCFICNNPEMPNCTMKLMSVKSEVRYSPNMIFVKLKNSYSISQFNILISDIKRSKMVSCCCCCSSCSCCCSWNMCCLCMLYAYVLLLVLSIVLSSLIVRLCMA